MNKKAFAAFAIVLGTALLVLAFFQLNQYMSASGLAGSVSRLAGAAGDAASYGAAYAEVLGAMLLPMALDFLLGAVFVVLGLALYPDEKKR
jgi:hypothetical protein